MLTEQEKNVIANLPKNFNINKESNDYNFMSSVRADFSRRYAQKLMVISTVFIVLSILMVVCSALVYITKPKPKIYVSTPSGKVYKLEQFKVN